MSRVIGPRPWPRVRYAIARGAEMVRGAVVMVPPSRGLRGRRLHGLDLELDLDLVADQHAARLEHLVPAQAEILAIDRRRRDEAGALVAPRVLGEAAELDV